MRVCNTALVLSCLLGISTLAGCGGAMETVRPVKPDAPVRVVDAWPQYVTGADRALLVEAQRRIEHVRKGELLVKVVDYRGKPVPGARVRWVQQDRAVRFGVDGPFDPAVWGDLVRIGVDGHVATLDWQATEPEAGVWTAGATAAAWGLDILPAMGLEARGGALTWFVEGRTPAWVKSLGSEALLDAVDAHVRGLVTTLQGYVTSWEALRDPTTVWAEAVGHDPDLIVQLAATAIRAVRDVDPIAPVLISFAHPLGEDQRLHPSHFVSRLAKVDAEPDAVGLQYLYNGYTPWRIMPRRSLVDIATNPEHMALSRRDLHVTAVGAPSRRHPTDPTLAGYWGRRWDEELQASYLEAFYVMAFANPAVSEITWQGAVDHPDGIVGGGLFAAPGEPRRAFHVLRDLLARWRTEGEGVVDKTGALRTRGFAGRWRIEVRHPETQRVIVTEAQVEERSLEAVTIQIPQEVTHGHVFATPWVEVTRPLAAAP